MSETKMYSILEITALLGTSRRTVERKINKAEVKGTFINGKKYFSEEELQKILFN